ncbi:uncharacterized protein At4g18490 [Cucumis melo]|uniref:Uncharacterized protein At4g18490 n=1 Tax=Cucumis melo TaxID=3656 RepID=A0ABM3L2S0_CUCME|nr:uncharacterized protein At4g18490 [Cucumis melo]
MAESRKGASSATDLSKKDSLLDEDIGNEFMKSWKSISVTEDDMVDFSFSTASKGKIKAFDFGTLDDDFNLDGSFEKLSSFKIDMPDLDFSSPPKKIEKARSSGKEGSSNGNIQKDIDNLNFSFDFKELDSFDIDKSLQNGEKSCIQQQDSKAVSSSRVECEASNIHIAEENTAIDNSIAKRLPASGNEKKKIEKARSSGKEGSSIGNNQKDIDNLNFSFDFKELDGFDVDKSLQNGEKSGIRQQDSKAVSSSRVECEASNIHIAEENTAIDSSIAKRLPASGNETSSTVENFQEDCGELESEEVDGTSHEARTTTPTTNKEEQFEKGCLSEKEVAKNSHQVIHDVPVNCVARNAPESTSEPQSEICSERVELTLVSGGTRNVTDENIDSDVTCSRKLPQSYLSPINIPASEKNKSECNDLNKFIDNVQLAEVHLDVKDFSNSDVPRKLLLDTQEIRENQNLKLKLSTVPLSRGRPINEVTVKEKEMGGNSSMSRTDVSKSQLQPSSISTKLFSLGTNRTDAPSQIPAAGDGDSRPHNKGAKTAPPVAVQREKSLGKLGTLSTRVNPSNSCARKTTQTHCSMEPQKSSMIHSQNAKTISAQGNKLCSIKASLIFPNPSSLKTSRGFGGKQVLSRTGGVQEKKLRESELDTEARQRSKSFDIGYCAENQEKQKLKRKALEGPNADSILLKPLKLFCVSPGGFRHSKDPLVKKIEQVERMTTASHDQLADSIEDTRVPNVMELEVSLVLENDRNVEKAEAYSQQLEDMCNMLKKKQNEAKDILVRALVNNNNLLMLNHPNYEEKISFHGIFISKIFLISLSEAQL